MTTTRLTSAEWRALAGAVDFAGSHWAETAGEGDGGQFRRNIDAADRALDKVRDAMTTPAVRRGRA